MAEYKQVITKFLSSKQINFAINSRKQLNTSCTLLITNQHCSVFPYCYLTNWADSALLIPLTNSFYHCNHIFKLRQTLVLMSRQRYFKHGLLSASLMMWSPIRDYLCHMTKLYWLSLLCWSCDLLPLFPFPYYISNHRTR